MKNWKKKFVVNGTLLSLAIVVSMLGLHYLMFPAAPIDLPVEVVKVEHANNATVTLACKWTGETKGILVFRCPDATRAGSQMDLVTHEVLSVHNGDTFEVNIPDQGWFVQIHDGYHYALEILADGTRQTTGTG